MKLHVFAGDEMDGEDMRWREATPAEIAAALSDADVLRKAAEVLRRNSEGHALGCLDDLAVAAHRCDGLADRLDAEAKKGVE